MVMNFIAITFVILPVMAGLLGIFFPAFGWFPIYGKSQFTIELILQFLQQPGILKSIFLSIFTAVFSTFISYWLCIFSLIFSQKINMHTTLKNIIVPLISIPHITVAIGILFLIQPSGWISRIISPWFTGWHNPPNLNIAPDLYGISLIIGLVVKELPFLLLIGFAIITQVNLKHYRQQISSLGYGLISGWFHVIHPVVAQRMRLSVLIVLCFAVSVVDMALILAPSTPAPLAVKIFNWYQSPYIESQFLAASGAVYLLLITIFCCAFWAFCGKVFGFIFRILSYMGCRLLISSFVSKIFFALIISITMLFLTLGIFSTVSAGVWAFVVVWQYPDFLPGKWGLSSWELNFEVYIQPLVNTLVIGIISSILALISAVIWLEHESRLKTKYIEMAMYLPLLLPQTGFLFGMQVLLISLKLDGLYVTLIWAHYLFVFPYILLSLSPTWRRWDVRYEMLGASFGFGKLKRLFRIKIPLLLLPMVASFTIGFSVSSALYLPTIFAGNGSFVTLTTEAVTLATGGSRQAAGIAALLQMSLPTSIFLIAGLYIRVKAKNLSYFKIQ